MSKPPVISEAEAIKELHALRSQLPVIEQAMVEAAKEQVTVLEAKQAALSDLQTKRQAAAQELRTIEASPATTNVRTASRRQSKAAALREVIGAYASPIQAAQAAVAAAEREVWLARSKAGTDTIRQIGVVENGVGLWRRDRIPELERELQRLKDPAPLPVESELKRLSWTLNELARGGQLPPARVVAPQPAPATTAPPVARAPAQPPAKPQEGRSAPPKTGNSEAFLRSIGVFVDPASGKLTVSAAPAG